MPAPCPFDVLQKFLNLIPAPVQLTMPCPACDGLGSIARLCAAPYDAGDTCERCAGEGEIPATCQLCLDVRPAMARVRIPGDTSDLDVCAECKADFDAVECSPTPAASEPAELPGLNLATQVRR
jgi:hypothetical protein